MQKKKKKKKQYANWITPKERISFLAGKKILPFRIHYRKELQRSFQTGNGEFNRYRITVMQDEKKKFLQTFLKKIPQQYVYT